MNLRYGRPAASPAALGGALMRKRIGPHRGRGRPVPARVPGRRPAALAGRGPGPQRPLGPGADGARRQPDDPQQPAARGDRHARAPARRARAAVAARRHLRGPGSRRPQPRARLVRAPCRVTGAGVRVSVAGPCRATPSTSCSTSFATPAPRRSRSATRGSWRATSRTARAAPCWSGTRRSGTRSSSSPSGQPQTLAGSLTRAGGPIAQLAARYPDVVITVSAEDLVSLPATERTLAPILGRPRL